MFGAWNHSFDEKEKKLCSSDRPTRRQKAACRPPWRSFRPHDVFRYATFADRLVSVGLRDNKNAWCLSSLLCITHNTSLVIIATIPIFIITTIINIMDILVIINVSVAIIIVRPSSLWQSSCVSIKINLIYCNKSTVKCMENSKHDW